MELSVLLSQHLTDIVIAVILLTCFLIGARKGLILSLIRTAATVISVIGAYILNPIVSAGIRGTALFSSMIHGVSESLLLGSAAQVSTAQATSQTQAQQISLIDGLTLNDTLKQQLLDNNNSVVYQMLGVDSIGDYIAGYISNIILNALVSVVIFLIIFIALRLAMGALGFIAELPLVKQVNILGGGLVGLASGIIFIWLLFVLMNVFITRPIFTELNNNVYASVLGKFLYDNNLIMQLIMGSLFK